MTGPAAYWPLSSGSTSAPSASPPGIGRRGSRTPSPPLPSSPPRRPRRRPRLNARSNRRRRRSSGSNSSGTSSSATPADATTDKTSSLAIYATPTAASATASGVAVPNELLARTETPSRARSETRGHSAQMRVRDRMQVFADWRGSDRAWLLHAYRSSQLVASRVAPLLAEQKNADHAGELLRFVRTSRERPPSEACPVCGGAAADR